MRVLFANGVDVGSLDGTHAGPAAATTRPPERRDAAAHAEEVAAVEGEAGDEAAGGEGTRRSTAWSFLRCCSTGPSGPASAWSC